MTDHKPLLIELGTEELPPNALDALADAFRQGICDGLETRGIAADLSGARAFCTPRRLAVHVPAVAVTQAEQLIERRGPSVDVGRDAEGKPTRALTGFARSCGVDADALDLLETDKGSWYAYYAVKPGVATASLLPDILAEALNAMPIPRPMRWGDHDYSFVRPAHWLGVLHGEQVVDVELLGLRSDRQSHGHRFHHPEPVTIARADVAEWQAALRKAHVMVDSRQREDAIIAGLREAVEREGLTLAPRLPHALVRELVNLTEWPVPILCRFDDEYLDLPEEVLQTAMEVHQRFISTVATEDGAGRLSPWFFGVANIESRQPREIRKGYERVIHPRFADAAFFYAEDRKTPLAEYQQALQKVTYQQSLGSLWDKSCRVAELSRVIANRVGVDAGLATRAASLCKCDLATRMVGEFPELQGIMGRYYALHHGEDASVAEALAEYYRPRHAGERIADGALSRVLAVADRLDTLCGIFAVGMKPTGNKDPFGLRRAALGLARTLIEGELAIDLDAACREALELIPATAFDAGTRRGKPPETPVDVGTRRAELRAQLRTFILDRLRRHYADQGFTHGQFEAVATVQPETLVDFDRRLHAVADFARRPEAASLAAANKRVGNILHKQADVAAERPEAIDPSLFEDDAERALAEALDAASRKSEQAVADGDYAVALAHLATLQTPVNAFFDQVLVMAHDPAVCANRLALLVALQARFMAIADVGQL